MNMRAQSPDHDPVIHCGACGGTWEELDERLGKGRQYVRAVERRADDLAA
jgi:hypothetical protein